MNTTKLLKNKNGFTLLEAMIATMIVGFVLASILAVSSHSFRYLSAIRNRARASQILQQKIEDIRLLTWTEVNALPSTFTDPSDTAGRFPGSITRTTYDTYGGTATVVNVTLAVRWQSSNGRQVTNSLSTLVSNGGLNKYIF